jgi:hypothetical protein
MISELPHTATYISVHCGVLARGQILKLQYARRYIRIRTFLSALNSRKKIVDHNERVKRFFTTIQQSETKNLLRVCTEKRKHFKLQRAQIMCPLLYMDLIIMMHLYDRERECNKGRVE